MRPSLCGDLSCQFDIRRVSRTTASHGDIRNPSNASGRDRIQEDVKSRSMMTIELEAVDEGTIN
jgi:hypothetical protein